MAWPLAHLALGGLVGTALAYATVGMYQWVTRDVFWNPGIIVGNAYAPFFRVNSVFWDPSIYGRYLAVAILVTLAGIVLGGVRGLRSVGAVRSSSSRSGSGSRSRTPSRA